MAAPGLLWLWACPVVEHRFAGAIPNVVALTVDDAGEMVRNTNHHATATMLPAPFGYCVLGAVFFSRLLAFYPSLLGEVLFVAILPGKFGLDAPANLNQAIKSLVPTISGSPTDGSNNAVTGSASPGVLVVKMEG